MAVIHLGTEVTLATIPQATINNGDIAYIWLNDYKRKMVYDSSSERAHDVVNHPYYVRPDDYDVGVWIEDVGADQPEAWNGAQIRTGIIASVNWEDGVAGTMLNLDGELLAIKDDTFAAAGVQIGWISGAAKIYAGDGANAFFQWDGSKITWKAANSELDASGNLIATSVNLTGTITATAGTIGGFTVNSTEGLYAGAAATRVQMKPGVGIWTGATAVGDSLNYLNVDGSGWLADGNISWTAAGVITTNITTGGSISLGIGADLILASQTGDEDTDRGVIQFTLNAKNLQIQGDYDDSTVRFIPSSSDVITLSLGGGYIIGGSFVTRRLKELTSSCSETVAFYAGDVTAVTYAKILAQYNAGTYISTVTLKAYGGVNGNASIDLSADADTGGSALVKITGDTRLTGHLTQSDAKYIATDEIRARDSDGLKLYDDSGAAGIFVKDGGNIGIGTASPVTKQHLAGATGSTNDWAGYSGTYVGGYPNNQIPQLIVARPYTYSDNGPTYIGGLSFTPNASGANGAGIYAINPNPGGSPGYGALRFWTTDWNGSALQTVDRLTITKEGHVGIGTVAPSVYADLTLEDGALCLKERTTPTADADYGKVYTKNDNKLYFQDGAGTEHEIQFV